MTFLSCKLLYYNDINPFSSDSRQLLPEVLPDFRLDINSIFKDIAQDIFNMLSPPYHMDESVFQICKIKDSQIDHGPFIEMELSLSEQELGCFLNKGDIGVLLRTKVTVRVGTIIESLTSLEGSELGRALISLVDTFRNDEDLVQEFIYRGGLCCLRNIGCKCDTKNIYNILRVIGDLMVYVDGMDGVFHDSETIVWMYNLLRLEDRSIMKLTLELLVIFMGYCKQPERHAELIIQSVTDYHTINGGEPWSLIMDILAQQYSTDQELVTYGMTFINKVLQGLVDQDSFYDVTDCLEEQGMEDITKEVFKLPNKDNNMIKQFQIYEAALESEDCDSHSRTEHGCKRSRQRSNSEINFNTFRKSKRFSVTQTLDPIIEDQWRRKNSLNPQELPSNVKEDGRECE